MHGNTKHGGFTKKGRTPEYIAWTNLLQRVNNPAKDSYKSLNLTVSENWLKFENFLEDMGMRPSPQHSIDRIDNDKGYSPENCRWATMTEQTRNHRRNRMGTIGGVKKCIAEWSEELELEYQWLYYQLKKRNWVIEDISII